MRTTLDIDDDVLIVVKEHARKERKSTGHVVSSIVRSALNGSRSNTSPDFIHKNGIQVLAPRGEVITLEHVNKLLAEEDY